MDETYRMLGTEHEADLEREALKWRHAAEVRERPLGRTVAPHDHRRKKRLHGLVARVAAFAARAVRADA